MRTIEGRRHQGRAPLGAIWKRRVAPLLIVGLGAAALMMADTACSFLVDTNSSQCEAATVGKDCGGFPGLRTCAQNVCAVAASSSACTTDTDCGAYALGVCSGGVCTRSCAADPDCGANAKCNGGKCGGGAVAGECAKNADCASKGQYYVCRKSSCVSLVNDLCTTVYATKSPASAAYADDSAVIFGSILPTAANADGPYGHIVEDSIKLALDDFGKVDGIPGLAGAPNRPLVLVGCNDGVNEDKTDDAAKHLIDDLGVPAIIGYAFSGNTITVAQDVTIPSGTLLFSPSATSAQITQLHATDKGLLWRTSPSDNVQAQALSLYYSSVEAAAKTKYPMIAAGGAPIKVAIVNHHDAYGSGLGDTLEGLLTFNGMSASAQSGTNYKRVDYGSSTSPDLSKVQDVVTFAPDIIFLFGFNEGVDQIFTSIEKQWVVPSDGHKPFYVFSDGGEVGSLWASSSNPMAPADIVSDDQRQRVSGSVPGVNASSWAPYGTFITEFNASSYAGDGSADTIGPSGAYDIFYLLAYSAVMAGSNPLTGSNLVKFGLSQMKKGAGLPQIQINRNNILTTFPQLTTGAAVNITGVSGPLPFDGKGDITTADIQIWCVPPSSPPSTDVGSAAINSGLYFDSANNKMTGCFSKTCGLASSPTTCP